MSALFAAGEEPDYLLWVGCAGAFDERYRRVVRAFVKILHHLGVNYAVLGEEETCTGDPARRAGNEMLYQMQALKVIKTLDRYGVKNVITLCPHCYNVIKNEYPDLGGSYNVVNYLSFLEEKAETGLLKAGAAEILNSKVTYHDPCYLGRANGIYEVPRRLMAETGLRVVEMKRNRASAFCCGAGGGQVFTDAGKAGRLIPLSRTKEAVDSGAQIIATACPFCMIMINDSLKQLNYGSQISNFDVAELIALHLGI